MKNSIYLVVYNDEVFNEASIEGYLSKKSDFEKWLKEHNKNRVADGNSEESSDDFTLIQVPLLY